MAEILGLGMTHFPPLAGRDAPLQLEQVLRVLLVVTAARGSSR